METVGRLGASQYLRYVVQGTAPQRVGSYSIASRSAPGLYIHSGTGGTPNTLGIIGGNPDLKPEKATVWTVGLDFKPPELAGFTARFTFYDIAFRDQIAAAGGTICSCDAFVDEAIFGPDVVQRNPPASLVQQLISLPTYSNPFGARSRHHRRHFRWTLHESIDGEDTRTGFQVRLQDRVARCPMGDRTRRNSNPHLR